MATKQKHYRKILLSCF